MRPVMDFLWLGSVLGVSFRVEVKLIDQCRLEQAYQIERKKCVLATMSAAPW